MSKKNTRPKSRSSSNAKRPSGALLGSMYDLFHPDGKELLIDYSQLNLIDLKQLDLIDTHQLNLIDTQHFKLIDVNQLKLLDLALLAGFMQYVGALSITLFAFVFFAMAYAGMSGVDSESLSNYVAQDLVDSQYNSASTYGMAYKYGKVTRNSNIAGAPDVQNVYLMASASDDILITANVLGVIDENVDDAEPVNFPETVEAFSCSFDIDGGLYASGGSYYYSFPTDVEVCVQYASDVDGSVWATKDYSDRFDSIDKDLSSNCETVKNINDIEGLAVTLLNADRAPVGVCGISFTNTGELAFN